MNRETMKTAVTGTVLFVAGVVSLFLHINDDGLFAYILLAYGAWEIGEAASDYYFGDQSEDEDRSWEEIKNGFKADVAKITIPLILTMLVEVVMIGTGFRLFTFIAYVLTLIIYLMFIGIFSYFELKDQEDTSYQFSD
ncbi:hypothetical protein [Alkalibacterium pelagium]|uniref:Uncharacterized protein n=1 Tax=Alkalibacterium pelagium TaxID=426702 RepID=A0A1H7K8V6_9LACT|nr:hypothetical protein [Alkalibacterium pelagium]GEN50826.1 hypothetical protein APE02nite_14910 [Alkalibacterium pelagium]SEK83278.1 hypothetical protein SAMN04488099_10744 [Alkalibacterium pelagium]